MAATSSSPPCSSSLSLSLSAKKVGQQRFPALRRFLFFFFLSFQPTPGLCRATSVRGKSVCVCVYCIYNLYVRAWGCGVSLSMPGSVVVLFQAVSAHTDRTSVFEAITHSWTQLRLRMCMKNKHQTWCGYLWS